MVLCAPTRTVRNAQLACLPVVLDMLRIPPHRVDTPLTLRVCIRLPRSVRRMGSFEYSVSIHKRFDAACTHSPRTARRGNVPMTCLLFGNFSLVSCRLLFKCPIYFTLRFIQTLYLLNSSHGRQRRKLGGMADGWQNSDLHLSLMGGFTCMPGSSVACCCSGSPSVRPLRNFDVVMLIHLSPPASHLLEQYSRHGK